MALIDTGTAPARPAATPVTPDASTVVADVYVRDGLLRRGAPFLVAIALGIVLAPISTDGSLERTHLLGATALLVVSVLLPAARRLAPHRIAPHAAMAAPYLYLLSIELVRQAVGGTAVGYGALLFLAPFWAALYEQRGQLVGTTLAVFLLQAGIVDDGFPDPELLRRAVLTTAVIAPILFAVHRSINALRAAQRRLETESAARAAAYEELAQSAEALQRSNRELEQFAYVSSHDIQEPLRMIRSFSQLFLQRHAHQVDAAGEELLGFVMDGAERAQQLVNDLLAYSRIGQSTQSLVPVPLDEPLDRALATLAPELDRAGGTVARPDALPVVLAETRQLESLFVNVIGNALKYRAEARAPRVEIATSTFEGVVTIRVRDNGIGFAPEHAERIFRMFHRLHGRTTHEGTGIGLAICQRIVERHGGTISAIGRPGEGAEVLFTLTDATAEETA